MSAYQNWIDSTSGNSVSPTFRGGFADPAPRELTYVPDHGSPAPLEDQDMALDSSTIQALAHMASRAMDLLDAAAPMGKSSVSWEFDLTTNRKGERVQSVEWSCSLDIHGTICVGYDPDLDVAVEKCRGALAKHLRAAAVLANSMLHEPGMQKLAADLGVKLVG